MKDYVKKIIEFAISGWSCIKFKSTAAAQIPRTMFVSVVIGASLIVADPSKANKDSTKAASDILFQSTCKTGAYRSQKGEVVVMLPRRDRHFRYVFTDGRGGSTADANPLAYCREGKVFVKQPSGLIEEWKYIPLKVTRTHFDSDGTTLSGKLVEALPAKGKPPLLVQVHGSNPTGWINGQDEWGHEAYIFAAHGISAFVFDKRGTGESAGEFTMNFERLAEDVVAAANEAKRLMAGRFSRFGLFASSQGGWVAPLAAKDAKADFMVLGSSLLLSPIEEDAEQVFLELKAKGYGADVLAKARTVTNATGEVRASLYRNGFEKLAKVKQLYGNEPWFKEIQGEFTGFILRTDENDLRRLEGRNSLGIMWRHDGIAVLRSLSVPALWISPEKDRVAPISLTKERLAILQKEGKPFEMAIFPDTDHGLFEFTETPDGKRNFTRFTDGYYRLAIDWIKGRLNPPYGKARFVTSK